MAKTVTLRVDDVTYRTLSKRAKAERRSLANFIEVAALDYIQRTEFADDSEMQDIVGNESLVRRLHEGSRHAAQKRGRFVG